jgi:hypothetical protein
MQEAVLGSTSSTGSRRERPEECRRRISILILLQSHTRLPLLVAGVRVEAGWSRDPRGVDCANSVDKTLRSHVVSLRGEWGTRRLSR